LKTIAIQKKQPQEKPHCVSFQEFLILRFHITATPGKINCSGGGRDCFEWEKTHPDQKPKCIFLFTTEKGSLTSVFIVLFYYYFWCCNCLDCCVRFAVCWTNSVKTCQHGLIFRMTLFHQSGPFAVSKFLDVINHQVYKKNLLARKR